MQSKNPIYNKFFSEVEWLENVIVSQSKTDSSYKFKLEDCDKHAEKRTIPFNTIKRVFQLKDVNKDIYTQAISGDGQEYKRITTLHSSTLAALLFFHSVSKVNPIKINGYTFNEVRFEQKTTVQDSHKSNMDVVLLNENEGIVMFLECKFSEYLNSGKKTHISPIYRETYQRLGLFDGALGSMRAQIEEGNDEIELVPSHNYQYCSGIKQMVSHYMGISNFIQNGFIDDMKLNFEPKRIFLTEILFDFQEIDDKDRLGEYKKAYSELAKTINADEEKPKLFEMLPECLTYQVVFKDFALPERIKEYYQL